MKLEGKAKLLRIHFGENDEWQGKPLYRAIVEKCKELDIAGATVFRGIEGYGASTLIRRAHLLSFSSDRPSWSASSIPMKKFNSSFRFWTRCFGTA